MIDLAADDLLLWTFSEMLLGHTIEQIQKTAVDNGHSAELVLEINRRLQDQFYFKNALRAVRRQTKVESLLALQYQLWRRSTEACAVRTFEALTAEEFLNDYYLCNRPVLLKGAARDWPAMQSWSFDYLSNTFGALSIEYAESENRYDDFSKHVRQATLGEFITRVTSTQGSNEFYLVGTNYIFRNEDARPLLKDLRSPSVVPDLDINTPDLVRLWIGPRDTITPLHHDVQNILFVQIVGSKEILLTPPCAMPFVENTASVFGNVDPRSPDLNASPLASQLTFLRVTVQPGDLLFIPVGWWHWVRSLEPSVSISFVDFAIDGSRYRWENAAL